MATSHVRLVRLAVSLALAGLLVGPLSARDLGVAVVARAATSPGTGGYSCPGSVGGRSLDGATNVGVPGTMVQGDASNDFMIFCEYPGSPSSWTLEVAWTPAGSTSHTYEGCGSVPRRSSTTVSRNHWAFAGTNVNNPPAELAGAARNALTTVEKLAAPCVSPTPSTPAAPPATVSPEPSVASPESRDPVSPENPESPTNPPSTANPTSVAPTSQPLCDEAIHYYGDDLSTSGIADPKVTRLRTNGIEILTGFTSVITAYNTAHPDAHAHAPVRSIFATMGAMNWLWEVGGLTSKWLGKIKITAHVGTRGYVTHTEPRLAQKIASSTHPLSPAEVFSLALDLNKGDVTNALLAAHNTLRALGRGDLMDQDLIKVLPAGPSMYGKHLADLREGAENSGPWYHLFGTAYFELMATETGQGAEGAQGLAFDAESAPAGPTAAGATALATAAHHFAEQLPEASPLSAFANWYEQRVRAGNGSKPDPEKYCMNVWGAQIGALLAQLMGGTAVYQTEFNDSVSDSEIDAIQSPFSMRWKTPQGTTTINQTTGAVRFGTPLLIYPLDEGSSWGAAIVPPANTSGTVTFVATAPGADLHFLRVDTAAGEAVLYRATASSAGEEMTLTLGKAAFGEDMKTSAGRSIAAQHLSLTTPSPIVDRSGDTSSVVLRVIGAVAVVIVLGAVGTIAAVMLRRRRARRRGATAPAGDATIQE